MTSAVATPTTTTDLCFDDIYKRYHKKVNSKCLSMLHSAEDAKDANQEIWIKVMNNLHRFESRSNIGTWVYSIAHRTCIDILRSKTRKQNQKTKTERDLGSIMYNNNIHEGPSHNPMAEHVYQLVQTSDDNQMELLRCQYFEGMSISDMANHFGLSESAIKMRLLRSRNKLKKVLKAQYQEPAYFSAN
ncbi:MAG: sigma-70 family RNA polymerase sigma factor [Bacteroidota bacterium]